MITREAIVKEALSWVKTPWHHEASVKGHGVDCAQLLRAVLNNCGASIRPTDHYPQDWHLHRSEERFMCFVLDYCDAIDETPLPGDILLWKVGRCFSHGAFYIGSGEVVHAVMNEGAVRVARISEGELGWRERRAFRWKGFS